MCTIVAAGASLLIPAVSARAVDQVLTGRTHAPAVVTLTGLLLLRVLAAAYGALARTSATTKVVASLRYRLLWQVFALGIPGLRRHAPGDQVSRLVGNAATGANAVPALVQIVVAAGTSLIGLGEGFAEPQPQANAGRPAADRYDVEVRGLTFAYGPHAAPVVQDLDLTIAEGEHLAVIGPSGIGKSTLASLLGGLLVPGRGTVRLGGVDVAQIREAA